MAVERAEAPAGKADAPPAAPASSPAPRWARVLIAVLLVAPMGLAIHSLLGKSLTWDEPIYLAGGHYLAYTHNFRQEASSYHPPLVFYWNSVGLLPLRLPRGLFPLYTSDHAYEVGMQVVFNSGHDPRLVRTLARLPFVLLIPMLGGLVYLWSRELWGWAGGLLSLWLVAWNPTLLAHARLVATDYLFTVVLVATLWSARGLLRRGGAGRLGRTGVFAGLAFLAKFSAVILGPVALVGAWLAWRPGGSAGEWRTWKAGRVVLGLVAIGLLAGTVLWAGYLFQVDRAIVNPAEREAVAHARPPESLVERAMLALYRSDVKLPAITYLMGFFSQYEHGAGGHDNYLLGAVRQHGWWYYFFVALAVKTPLPELLLWLGGAVAWVRARRAAREALWLGAAPVVLLVLSLTSNINIGVRHILPVYPVMAIAAGACVRWMSRHRGNVVIGLLAAWQLLATLNIHPDYLTYFNPLAGGAPSGYRVLVDSNLDWGQDLDALVEAAQGNGWLPLQVQYFGPPHRLEFTPEGIEPLREPCRPHPGYVAVSVTNRVGAYMNGRVDCFDWLDQYAPIEVIHHTIWVYHVPEGA